MLARALEHLVRGIVTQPDEVQVRSKRNRRGTILEIRVASEDLGRVIGRAGRVARALRQVINAISPRGPVRIDVIDDEA